MNTLQNALAEVLMGALVRGDFNKSDIHKASAKFLKKVLPLTTGEMIKRLKRAAPKMLRKHREADARFCRRNYRRWRQPFDLLEMMWVIAEEVGTNFNETYRPEAAKDLDYQFEALTFLHARSLLVIRESICLLHGGFPDGALSRWRTLHELAVIAVFLQRHDREVAHRYLPSFHFQAYSAAEQLETFGDRAGLVPFSDRKMEEMKKSRDGFAKRFGEAMRYEYGWAGQVLKKPKAKSH